MKSLVPCQKRQRRRKIASNLPALRLENATQEGGSKWELKMEREYASIPLTLERGGLAVGQIDKKIEAAHQYSGHGAASVEKRLTVESTADVTERMEKKKRKMPHVERKSVVRGTYP